MAVLANTMAGIILQDASVSNEHAVHLKLTQYYLSIKPQKEFNTE